MGLRGYVVGLRGYVVGQAIDHCWDQIALRAGDAWDDPKAIDCNDFERTGAGPHR